MKVFIDVIIPIMLFVIGVIIIVIFVLKKANDHIKEENKKVKELENKNKKYKDIDTSIIYKEINLENVKEADTIKKTIFNMYKEIIDSYTKFDKKTLKEYTGNVLYNNYLDKMEELDKNYEQEIIKNITLNDIRILDISKNKKIYNMKFYLNISCYNYKIDKKSKITMHGFDDRKIEQELIINFEKDEEKCVITKIAKVGQKTLPKEKKNGKKK